MQMTDSQAKKISDAVINDLQRLQSWIGRDGEPVTKAGVSRHQYEAVIQATGRDTHHGITLYTI